MIRTGTLNDVADEGTFNRSRLGLAWKLLSLPERIDQEQAVAVTIVSTLLGSGMGKNDREGAARVLALVHEAWSQGLPPSDVHLIWRGGNVVLHAGDPYEAEVEGDGATHLYELRQWATGAL